MSAAQHHVLPPGNGPDIAYHVPGDDQGRPRPSPRPVSEQHQLAPVISTRPRAAEPRPRLPGPRTIDHLRPLPPADYVHAPNGLLQLIGEPAVVIRPLARRHRRRALAQDRHPLVAAVFLEDPRSTSSNHMCSRAAAWPGASGVLRDHIERLQAEEAPVHTYRDLLAVSPHPAGDRLGDHLHDDALWSRPEPWPKSTPPRSPRARRHDLRRLRPRSTVAPPNAGRAGRPVYDAAFQPAHEQRLHGTSPDVAVIPMSGAGHNIRGDRGDPTPLLERPLRLPHPTTRHNHGDPIMTTISPIPNNS